LSDLAEAGLDDGFHLFRFSDDPVEGVGLFAEFLFGVKIRGHAIPMIRNLQIQ